jgi:hypothetical protein
MRYNGSGKLGGVVLHCLESCGGISLITQLQTGQGMGYNRRTIFNHLFQYLTSGKEECCEETHCFGGSGAHCHRSQL